MENKSDRKPGYYYRTKFKGMPWKFSKYQGHDQWEINDGGNYVSTKDFDQIDETPISAEPETQLGEQDLRHENETLKSQLKFALSELRSLRNLT